MVLQVHQQNPSRGLQVPFNFQLPHCLPAVYSAHLFWNPSRKLWLCKLVQQIAECARHFSREGKADLAISTFYLISSEQHRWPGSLVVLYGYQSARWITHKTPLSAQDFLGLTLDMELGWRKTGPWMKKNCSCNWHPPYSVPELLLPGRETWVKTALAEEKAASCQWLLLTSEPWALS